MKTLKKRSQCLGILLVVVLLFQSCQVYKSKSSTLDEAVASNQRVKIHSISGERIKYKKIIKKEGLYYGLVKKDTVKINTSEIARLRLKDHALSTVYTVLVSAVSGLVMLVLVSFNSISISTF